MSLTVPSGKQPSSTEGKHLDFPSKLDDAQHAVLDLKATMDEEALALREERASFENMRKKLDTVHFKKHIKLNVGGQIFKTSIETLVKDPDSMFAAMFSKRFEVKPDEEDGAYFIDRDGTHFRYILNYLRTGQLIYPKENKVLAKELYLEAKFYQILDVQKTIWLGVALQNSSYIISSLTDEQRNALMSWLPPQEIFINWVQLYSSSQGWSSNSFHQNCNNKGPTVIIARAGNHIFGGYADVSWNSVMEDSVDSAAPTKTSRAKHKCPYPECEKEVVHLPRHMRNVHGWCKEKSSGVLNAFNLRKPKASTSQKKVRNYKRRMCPIDDCTGVVKRIHNHLVNVHKIKRGSAIYRKALKAAHFHDPEDIIMSEESEMSDESERSEQSEISNSSSEDKSTADPDFQPNAQLSTVRNSAHPSIFKRVYGSDDESEIEEPDWASVSPVEGNMSLESGDEMQRATSAVVDVLDTEEDGTTQDQRPNQDFTPSPPSNSEKKATCSPADKKILLDFRDWLKGPDGGRKDDKCAQQCMRQVKMVTEFIDAENPCLTMILSKNILRDDWLKKFEKEKRPGTLKSYLGTLNQFYVYLQAECSGNILNTLGVTAADLVSLSNQVKLWASSYRKLCQDRFWEKRVEDLSNKKTPEQIKQFEASEVARTAIKLLGEYNDKEQLLTQAEYTAVRDYLLTIICINNGSRAGNLCNMTLDEFGKATFEDECYVVRVKNHKTSRRHGPVCVVLHPSLHKYVQIFISKMRNNLPDADLEGKRTVFLTWTGCEMVSSQVGQQIGSCWGKVYGKAASTGGATSFRKAVVSAVHEKSQDLREDLASLMVHNKSTADKYYLLENKGKTAVRTSKKVSRIMRGATSPKKQPRDKDGEEPSTSSCNVVSSTRHQWLENEIAAVKDVFSSNIQNKSISLDEVRNTAKDHPVLNNIDCTKIRDKVRSLFSLDHGNDDDNDDGPACLPTEEESQVQRCERLGLSPVVDFNTSERDCESEESEKESQKSETSSMVIPPSTTSKGSKSARLFTPEDNEKFQEIFKDLINSKKQILSSMIISRLQSHNLNHLVENFTKQQLADKVRTERKIAGRSKRKR